MEVLNCLYVVVEPQDCDVDNKSAFQAQTRAGCRSGTHSGMLSFAWNWVGWIRASIVQEAGAEVKHVPHQHTGQATGFLVQVRVKAKKP
jgi:hypothetical protein